MVHLASLQTCIFSSGSFSASSWTTTNQRVYKAEPVIQRARWDHAIPSFLPANPVVHLPRSMADLYRNIYKAC